MLRALSLISLAVAVMATIASAAPQVAADGERLYLTVLVDELDPQSQARLLSVGFEIERALTERRGWQGWLPADRLDDLRALPGILSVDTSARALFAAGDTLTEGDELLNAASARERFNVDGSGVRVAVISDGIIGLEEAILANEAPRLREATAFGQGSLNGGQEGTAMIEIVHDIAPGASISFGAVYESDDHIEAVNHFAKRVDIIVDDVSFAYPADQRSAVSTNTTRALRRPDWPLRLYVTAAGNWAEAHWSGRWIAGPEGNQIGLSAPGATHRFNGATAAGTLRGAGNGFNVEQGDEIRLALFWDDPWGRSTNDYNLFLMTGAGEVLASSERTQGVGADSHIPREHLTYAHETDAAELFAVIQNRNNDAAAVNFDLFVFTITGSQASFYHRTPQGSLLAQSDAADALTVGAVNAGRRMVASYSSRGPTANGAPKPELSAVDSVSVSRSTFYAPQFKGSSAAAPHVAAVAALLLDLQQVLLDADGGSPLLERRLIRDILIGSAQDIPPAGVDHSTGAGLIDADEALEFSSDEIAVIESAADSGPGSFREALSGGASILLFAGRAEDRTIVLESELPAIPDGLTVDGAGWTLDASNVAVGLRMADDTELWGLSVIGAGEAGIVIAGDRSRLVDVTVDGNEVGIRVDGDHAKIEGAKVLRGGSGGVVVSNGASAAISGSVFESNRGPGLKIHPRANDVTVGPDTALPALSKASEQYPPIGELGSPAPEPRSGLSHSIRGSLSIDGLPAASGNRVDIYLDRRLAASVNVDHQASFSATVTGPGRELRFAVNGATLDQRVPFAAGASTTLTLRALSRLRLAALDQSGEHIAGANQFQNNLAGIEIVAGEAGMPGRRFVWGNLMRRNRINVISPLSAPTIDEARWSAAGLSLGGRADGASVVHLYAGSSGQRRFAGSTPVIGGRFRFEYLDVDQMANEFSVISHSAGDLASAESDVHREAEPGSISSISPQAGYIDGGETVQICGHGIATDTSSPRVWFGNAPARVMFWSGECVSVQTPRAHAGPADVALLLSGSRPIIVVDGFEYRPVRVVRLKPGHNLVTWTGSDTRVTSAFSSLAGATFRAFAWDADAQQWQTFATDVPPRLNTLRSLKQYQSLWILLDSEEIDWLQPAPN